MQEEIKKLKHLRETPTEHMPVNTTETSTSKSKGNSKTRKVPLY